MDFLHLRKLPTDYKLHNLRELFRKEKELQFFFTEIAEIQLTTTENWKTTVYELFEVKIQKTEGKKQKTSRFICLEVKEAKKVAILNLNALKVFFFIAHNLRSPVTFSISSSCKLLTQIVRWRQRTCSSKFE